MSKVFTTDDDDKICKQAANKNNSRQLRTSFLRKLVESDDKLNLYVPLNEINKIYHCNFDHNYYSCLIIQPYIQRNPDDNKQLSQTIRIAENMVISTFAHFNETLIYNYHNLLYCIFNDHFEVLNCIKKDLQKLNNSLQTLTRLNGGNELHFFISHPHKGLSKLPRCMKEAKYASYDQLITHDPIIEYSSIPKPVKMTDIITWQFRKNLLRAVETLDVSALAQCIEIARKSLLTNAVTGKTIHDTYDEILHIYVFAVKNYNLEISYDTIYTKLKHDFQYYTDTCSLMAHLLTNLKNSLAKCRAEQTLQISKPIQLAREYIKAHYHEPLNLETIGNHVNLSSSYLSSIFKKETGLNFIDYLNEVRIEKAKQLLLEEHNSLTFISRSVGFHSLKYFIKRFKKSTGLTPAEYCKRYS